MNLHDYIDLETDILKTALDIAKAKRPAYTGENEDVLHNFKEAAKAAGVTPLQAWIVLAKKHWDCLATYARNPEAPQAESLESRVADLINYAILFWGLVNEGKPIPYFLSQVEQVAMPKDRSSD